MKKLRTLTLLTFVLAMGLCSCSSNDDENQNEKKEELTEAQILGTWTGIVPVTENSDKGLVRSETNLNVVVTFESAGVGSTDNIKMPSSAKLKYKIDGKTLDLAISITEANTLLMKMKVLSINDKTMDIQFLDKDNKALYGGKTITFTKAVGTLGTQILGKWGDFETNSIVEFNADLSGKTSFYEEGYQAITYTTEKNSVIMTFVEDTSQVCELRVRIIDATTMIGQFYDKKSGNPIAEGRNFIFTKQ